LIRYIAAGGQASPAAQAALHKMLDFRASHHHTLARAVFTRRHPAFGPGRLFEFSFRAGPGPADRMRALI
jgi:hypothetical protein